MAYRIQRSIAVHGVPGVHRAWQTVKARGRRVVAERLALNLRVDDRHVVRADRQPSYRIVARGVHS